jgi:FkbM family methyltransferase
MGQRLFKRDVEMSIVFTRYGKFRIIDSDNVISYSLKEYGEWAQQEVDLLLRFIKPGDRVADVGAFIGTHSRVFSSAVGVEGIVYAFEPRNEIVEILLENVNFSPIQNIKVFQCGLGHEHKEIKIANTFEDSKNNFGGFSINAPMMMTESGDTIQLRTLDEVSIMHLDFLKLDVEGMEIDVLLGGDATLSRDRPIIFAEVNSLRSGIPLLHWCLNHQYAMLCALYSAYNPQNYNNNIVNYFSDAVEVGALLLPKEEMSVHADCISSQRLVPTSSPDDLALVLLHKPQYVAEVLKYSDSASVLNVDFLQRNRQADSELIGLSHRLIATEQAKNAAERLAIDRLLELGNLHQRLALTEQAKNAAERLAIDRLLELENLHQQLNVLQNSAWWRITKKIGLIPGIVGNDKG